MIFNYPQTAEELHVLISPYKCHSILELGCGTGYLAPFLIEKGYLYTGLDISNAMLEIARNRHPEIKFILNDMRNFNFEMLFDAIISSGRGFCHLIQNDDVFAALNCIYKALKPGGIVFVDNFDATSLFSNFSPINEFTYEIDTEIYKRIGKCRKVCQSGWKIGRAHV